MTDVQHIEALGLKPSDYRTSTLEEIAAAAKEFERLLNGAPIDLLVDIRGVVCRNPVQSITKFIITVRQNGPVYP